MKSVFGSGTSISSYYVNLYLIILLRNFPEMEPVYAQVDCRSKKHASSTDEVFTHRRYLSADANTDSKLLESVNIASQLSTSPSQPPLAIDIHSLATLPSHARRECFPHLFARKKYFSSKKMQKYYVALFETYKY